MSAAGSSGNSLTYRLLADGVEFYRKTVVLMEYQEVEHFETVDVGDLGFSDASQFSAEVTSITADGREVGFLLQVLRMDGGARYRTALGIGIFVITFASIVAEQIHRSYSAFMGASVTLCIVAAIQETPNLHHVTAMVDWGTLALLFSMMILMQMLAITGFFNWFALKTILVSKQRPVVLFFLLTNIAGIMSMVLDNVTCVLLTGPLVYKIASRMQLNPRVLYLSMTICATVGGTATLIGDPPNIVIGSKLSIGFDKFLIVNLPVVLVGLLPLSSALLYWRFRKTLCYYTGEPPVLDMDTLQGENRIKNQPMFAKLGCILMSVLVCLFLSPVHMIEPSWFCMMAFFASGLLFDSKHMGKWLEFVEWDTLFFFALLFVLVESLSELGVIRAFGEAIVGMIESFPENVRMSAAIVIILWVSGIGSAFLESLPYTTTLVYVISELIMDEALHGSSIKGVKVSLLVWPLSIGACVGGIGSIMGSSANLVCMAVSARYAIEEDEKVQGIDFLKFGLPVLLANLCVASFWLLLLFAWVEAEV
eukprot:gnl/TRDRNA2_/TRDRNA2_163632_c0_seq2.p1 gnl/TRDRNA2_/TRDRNA2_163632_c0~~gnl/TRDRNA2_/TRDRNA2_163632_c0_seq2.p1  ORF type:complete len:619 (-),score=103.23 gnl/TRDRNA2_/TRDRNA2_163632_c0_seq2:112-1719(-)